MTVPKVSQQKLTETIDMVQWAVHGNDAEAALKTRMMARQCGPEAVAFLNYVIVTDGFASPAQRVRAAVTLLEVGEFLASEAKATGLFSDAEEGDGADGRAGA